MPRLRFTLLGPDGEASSFTTRPLELIEARYLIFVATQMLARGEGWRLVIEHIHDDDD